MNTKIPEYMHGVVRLPLESAPVIDLPPQQCWELIDNVRSFLIENCTEFDQPPVRVVKKNRKSFQVAVTKRVDWWSGVENASWEPNTYRIFDRFISSDSIYVDIGAWIGPTVLYAAQLAKCAYAFEPDPIAFRELKANVDANKETEWVSRLTIYNKAISSVSGICRLGNRGCGGDSMSSVLFSGEETNWEVEAITLEQFLEAEKLQNGKLFLKIDIEGGEYELVPKLKEALAQYDVDVYLSIHPEFLATSLKRRKTRSKILQRLFFVWHQIKLVRSLPFRYLYHSNGRKVSLFKQILKALVLGGFLGEVVATNKKWENAST